MVPRTTEKRGHTNPLPAAGDEADVEESEDDQPLASIPRPPASSNSKRVVSPPTRTQEGFYPYAWQLVIEGGKNNYRLLLHTGPSCFCERNAENLNDAHLCVMESLDAYQRDPEAEVLDDCEFFSPPRNITEGLIRTVYFDLPSLAILVCSTIICST